MKNKKILLGVVLGLLVFSFVPTVLGSGVIKRSLDTDWFRQDEDPSFSRNNPVIGWWASEQLIIFPHHDSNWYPIIPIWECDDYHGHVIEREMSDGRHMITVTIIVKGAPVMVETFNPDDPVTLFEGKMNYIYRQKFIIDLNIWPNMLVGWLDDDGFEDETGYVILPTYYIPVFDTYYIQMMGLEFVSVLFVGTAKGVMLNSWNGLEKGDTARLNVGAFGSAKKGLDLINPPNPGYMEPPFGDIWPLDYIKLH